ncbi:MAG TPA: gliding motility-associated C-terminal domain-containing protein, partial [Prolixibacteraceae bacterium]|nr:gliding motility-associated C-terminal domain-containing protein [Prolixibacteraceae bacterium]
QAGEIKSNKPEVTFQPESFSPNLDGYNDEFQIQYQLNRSGYLANVWIFDAAGRPVLQLAKNEILATNGNIVWNGEDETGKRQPLGVYVVMVEVFNGSGEIYRFKEGVVLTDLFD